MTEDRKPSQDAREGLSLLLRAAKTAARRIDVAKLDKGLDRAISQVGRVVGSVGRVVADEINRMASSPPPWSRDAGARDEESSPKQEGEGSVWASDAQQAGSVKQQESTGKGNDSHRSPDSKA